MRKTIKQLQGESDYWRVKFINEQQRAEAAEARVMELEALIASQQPADDGWIEWAGGERPVPKGTMVDVKWSNGSIDERQEAGEWRWKYCTNVPNIIAYRVVKL